jgi:hypothetical protein
MTCDGRPRQLGRAPSQRSQSFREGEQVTTWVRIMRFNEDEWPVANTSSVGDVAASHRFHYCADREMRLPEVLGWAATEGMSPWC